MQKAQVTAFFDEATNTISYVVQDPSSKACAVIDSLLDYDAASGTMKTTSADKLINFITSSGLELDWIIDTHVHADHLTAALYIKKTLGGRTAIGEKVTEVQEIFSKVFNEPQSFQTDGGQFDHLFQDGETYTVGNLQAKAIHTPGHTPACMVHVIGDAAFVGDTLFMPDYGTARCDFPGGDAHKLYNSVQKIYDLPDQTRLFMCHDYKAPGRDKYLWETTVAEQKQHNIHINQNVSEEMFVKMRSERDKTLSTPELLLPSVQINMRAGDLPAPEANGQRYLKVPITALFQENAS